MVNCCNLLGAVLVSGFVETGVDSKYLSYGLVDNPEPIMRTSASLLLEEWVSFGYSLLNDLTDYGRRATYTSRCGRWTELDPGVSLVHSIGMIDWTLGWSGEYHPAAMGHKAGDWGESTQFVNASIGATELFLEPTLTFERDVQRDQGSYLNLEIGHDFPCGLEGVMLRPSVSQGWGDCRRVGAYLMDGTAHPLRRCGLMDLAGKLALTWQITETLAFSGYIGISDYAFDPVLRSAARRYEVTGHHRTHSVCFGGLAVKLAF